MDISCRPLSAMAFAGLVTFGLVLGQAGAVEAQSRNTTRAYAGVALSFGAGDAPGVGLVAGLQAVRVSASNGLRGIDLNARYTLRSGFDRFAVAGLVGRRSAYLNLGAGFDPLTAELFVTGAAQTRHLRAGIDYGLISGYSGGYFEANTLQRPNRYVPPPRAPRNVGNGASDEDAGEPVL